MTTGAKPSVIFVVGYGRSGSTLLDRLLGLADGVFSAGELRNIWRRGFERDQLCGCGAKFSQCEVWREVVTAVFGTRRVVPAEMLALRQSCARETWIKNFLKSPGDQIGESQHRYLQVWHDLYNALGRITGAKYIVDSSKHPLHAFLFGGEDAIDARYLHLIRDCRATAYSRSRSKIRPEVSGGAGRMPVRGPYRSTLRWIKTNRRVERLGKSVSYYTSLKYEDVVRDPAAGLAQAAAALGMSLNFPAGCFGAKGVEFPPHHMVSGNPVRFESGLIPIREDVEWRKTMPKRRRAMITLAASPLLRRYGYL